MSQSVLQLSAPALECVRIALLGLGSRGLKTLERYQYIEGVRFTALADPHLEHLEAAQQLLRQRGASAPLVTQDSACALASPEVDLVIICTDWYSHCELACAALEQGKHVALEVPAALSISDCWRLVHTAERTRRHCFLMENCCFDPFHLEMLARAEAGDFGQIKHCEGAYIHNLQGQNSSSVPQGTQLYSWMGARYPYAAGNAYPTHGLGPIAQLLGIHRGQDRFVSLYACSSTPELELAQRHSSILLRTERGRTALLQLDLHSPRPYSRLQSIAGTEGYMSKYPLAMLQQRSWSAPLVGEALEQELRCQPRSPLAPLIAEGEAKGVPNVMNYTMDAHLIGALRSGSPLAISVYDAALWSACIELSARSEQEQRPVDFPSFL